MSGLLDGRRGLIVAIVMVGLAVLALGWSADSDTVWGVAGPETPTSAPAKLEDAVATAVVDAQTIEVEGGQSVRFIGIASPTATDCYGREALAHTRELLPPGTPIRLQYDEQRSDDGGRTLAYVYRQKDGLFVNLALAEAGFARESIEAPNLAHVSELVTATAEAEAQRKGLWAKCGDATTVTTAPTGPASGPTTTAARAAGSTVRPASAASVRSGANASAGSSANVIATTTEACHPSYAGACLPIGAKSVKCSDVGGREFGVVGPDVYNLDPDHNGIACESKN